MTQPFKVRAPIVMSLFALMMLVGLIGCGEGRGFALPSGDVSAGENAFVKFNCNACHSTADIPFKGADENLHLALGGQVASLKSYGELVTSIINPSHKIDGQYGRDVAGNSQMRIYNDVMTVQELVDIVTFLQAEYEIDTPSDFYYPY